MVSTSAGEIAALSWSEAGSEAPLRHFAHATGFNAHTYRRLLEPLSKRFRIAASDARGHGRTRLLAIPENLVSWQTYEADLERLLEVLGEPAFLIGHSIGATVSLMLAAKRPDLALGVAMIEPSFVPFNRACQVALDRREGNFIPFDIALQARKRRPIWSSQQEIRNSYSGKAMFSSWREGLLDDYLEGGLHFLDDGRVALACDPAWEAATFQAATTEFWELLPRYKGKVSLAYGSRFSTVSEADAAKIVELAPQARVFRFRENSHFLPMECPEAIAQMIEDGFTGM
ncbi:MAG: alpha/beta fold hydrolase [Bradyrhizobium sp.]